MQKTSPPSGALLTRRRFLAAVAGVGIAGSAPTGRRGPARDARLTVRPRRPSLPFERGATELGADLERGALLYVPTSYDPGTPAPLVVALHGGGGSAERWRSWFEICDRRGLLLAAPESRGRTWDRASGSFGPDVRFIDAVLRYTFDRCAVDPERLALSGFSDGASYALSLGPSNGDLFTHLLAFSPGFSNPEEPIVGRPRVFIAHGDRDRVLPVLGSRDGMAPMFEMDGYDVTYREFDGAHEMPGPIVTEALDWFLE